MTTGQIVTAEQSLYADLVSEAIQIHGHDVFYLSRDFLSGIRTSSPIPGKF